MKKSTIGIIVAVVMVIGAALLLVGCVGKGKVNSSSDMVITNTYQVKDISKNKMIQEEARQRLVAMMAENNLKPDGEVDFVRVAAYNTHGNDHYIAIEFRTRVIGRREIIRAVTFLKIKEDSGQYTVVRSIHNLTGRIKDPSFDSAVDEVLNRVKTCNGALPTSTEKM